MFSSYSTSKKNHRYHDFHYRVFPFTNQENIRISCHLATAPGSCHYAVVDVSWQFFRRIFHHLLDENLNKIQIVEKSLSGAPKKRLSTRRRVDFFGRSVVRSFGCSVVRSFGRSVVRSFGRLVVRSFGRTVE